MITECDVCTEQAEFEFDVEDNQSVTPRACSRHLGNVAGNVIDVWGEHGAIGIVRANVD